MQVILYLNLNLTDFNISDSSSGSSPTMDRNNKGYVGKDF